MSEENNINPQENTTQAEVTGSGTTAAESMVNELTPTSGGEGNIEMLMDIKITLSMEIGRTKIKLRDLLNLNKGSLVELDKTSGDALDIMANGRLIAHGDIVSINGKYGIRVTKLVQGNNKDE